MNLVRIVCARKLISSLPENQTEDLSNGYEALSATFIAGRKRVHIGAVIVHEWARKLAPGSAVLDLGCGGGVPISQALIENGLVVYGIDASPGMTKAFSENFPQAKVVCEAVEQSSFFDRQFDAVISWGLFFLLPAATQLMLIQKVANALIPNGRFLFTSPRQVCTWKDNLTKRDSWSLGADAYKSALNTTGFTLLDEYDDEGENHYYDAVKC